MDSACTRPACRRDARTGDRSGSSGLRTISQSRAAIGNDTSRPRRFWPDIETRSSRRPSNFKTGSKTSLGSSGQNVLVYLRVEDRAELAITSTLFRFAQYFGWTEVIRRVIEFCNSHENVLRLARFRTPSGRWGGHLRPTSSVWDFMS